MNLFFKNLIMLLLLFVTTLLVTESISTEVLICETTSLNISCPQSTNIHINNAEYGRTSQLNCPKDHYDQNVNCSTNNSTEVTRQRCEGLQNCTVTADNTIYGDPCSGTYKYLDINYTCVAKTNKNDHIVCENDNLILECPPDNILEIKSADYGRHSTTICPLADHDQFTQCSLDGTKKVSKICNGHRSCKMEVSNKEFGKDPCYLTYKYLNVTYICKLRPNIKEKEKITCYDKKLVIKCPGKTTIKVISADFGRQSKKICPDKDKRRNEFTGCSLNETEKLSQRCDGLNKCQMNVDRNEFPIDPCYGTYKYLKVNYYCQV